MLQALAAAGVAVNPLLWRAAFADEREANATEMLAAVFFDSYATAALRRALHYAGDRGYVASLPQLLGARVRSPYHNVVWNTWFTANSEESVVPTANNNPVVVVVHGGGIFASPQRFERSYRADLARANAEGLTGQYAAKITAAEAKRLLQGRLPDGAEIPLYPLAEFQRGVAEAPRRYGVVLDFALAKRLQSGFQSFDALRENPLMIARAGGVKAAAAYLDKAQARHNTQAMGFTHPFHRIDPQQPQTRILNLGGNPGGTDSEGEHEGLGLGYDLDWGIGGNNGLVDMARYLAVASGNPATSAAHIDFPSG